MLEKDFNKMNLFRYPPKHHFANLGIYITSAIGVVLFLYLLSNFILLNAALIKEPFFQNNSRKGIVATTQLPSLYLPLIIKAQDPWQIRSISSMNQTKDRICNQRSSEWITQWVARMKELGATHVGIETPYDSPNCGDSAAYTERWIQAIRAAGLKVWHRHMPLAFEGIYGTSKNPSFDYLSMIHDYITAHPNHFQEGDIFTPIPEPQNGGIQGVTNCTQNICIFQNKDGSQDAREEFNTWIRDAMRTSKQAFESIGLRDAVNVGYFGFDGYVAWGDNNPDWEGIIEPATVQSMGNILAIDHYPEAVGDTMENDLRELHERFPGVLIVISEWGTITGGDIEQQVLDSMGAVKRDPLVIGFQYWQGGPAGSEALINDDFTKRPQFDEVQSFYQR